MIAEEATNSLATIATTIDRFLTTQTHNTSSFNNDVSTLQIAIRSLVAPPRAALRRITRRIVNSAFHHHAVVNGNGDDVAAFAALALLPTLFAADSRSQLTNQIDHIENDSDIVDDDNDDESLCVYFLTREKFSAQCAPHLLDALLDCSHLIVGSVDESIRNQLIELRERFDSVSRVAVVRLCFLTAQRLESAAWTRLAVVLLADVPDLNDRSALLYVVELALQHSLALTRLVLSDVASRAVAVLLGSSDVLAPVNAVVDVALLLLLAGATSARRLTVVSVSGAVLCAALNNRFDRDLYRSYAIENVAASSSAPSSSSVDDVTLLARAVVRGGASSSSARRLLALAQCLAQLRWRSVHSRSLQSAVHTSGGALLSLSPAQVAALRTVGASVLRELFVAHEGARATVIASIAQPLIELRNGGVDAEALEAAAAHVAVLESLMERHVALCLPHAKAIFEIVSQLFAGVGQADATVAATALVHRAVSAALQLCRSSQAMFDDVFMLLRKWIRAREWHVRALALSTAIELLASDLVPYVAQRMQLFDVFCAPTRPVHLHGSDALITDDDVRAEWRDLPPVVVLALVQCAKESADLGELSHALDGVVDGGDGDSSAADLFALVARELPVAPLRVRSRVYDALDRLRLTRSRALVAGEHTVVPSAPLLAAVKALLVRQLARCFRRDGDSIELSLEHCFEEQWNTAAAAATAVIAPVAKPDRRRSSSRAPAAEAASASAREDIAQLVRVLQAFDGVAPDTIVTRSARAMLDSLQATLVDPVFAHRIAVPQSRPTSGVAKRDASSDANGKAPIQHNTQWLALFANELDLVRCDVDQVAPRVRCALIAPLYDVFVTQVEGEHRFEMLEMAALVGAVAGTDGAARSALQSLVDAERASVLALDMVLRTIQCSKDLSADATVQHVAFALAVYRRRFIGGQSVPSELQRAAGVAVSAIELECRALQCVVHVCNVGERAALRRAVKTALSADDLWRALELDSCSIVALACGLVTQLHKRVSEGVELPLLQAYVNAASSVASVARGDDDARLDLAAREMLTILDEYRITHATVIRLFLRFVFACAQPRIARAVARRIVNIWADVLDCAIESGALVQINEETDDAGALVGRVSFGDSAATRRAALMAMVQHLCDNVAQVDCDTQWMSVALDLLTTVFCGVLADQVAERDHDADDDDDDDDDDDVDEDDNDDDEDDVRLDSRLASDGTIARCLLLLSALVERTRGLLSMSSARTDCIGVIVRVMDLTAKLLGMHRKRHVLIGHNVQQRLPKLMQVAEQLAIDVRAYVNDATSESVAPNLDDLKRAVGAFERAAPLRDAAVDAKALSRLRKNASVVSRKRSRQLRSRNAWIDAALAEEDGNDTFADLEDFVEA
jgi:hypothetical protein